MSQVTEDYMNICQLERHYQCLGTGFSEAICPPVEIFFLCPLLVPVGLEAR